MPTPPRGEVVAEDEVAVVHCYTRVVQQARLCGVDPLTRRDYSYRKKWVERGLKRLAGLMGVEVLDFSVLDNHLHTMLRLRPDKVRAMSDSEVVRRWCHLCPTTGLTPEQIRKRPPGRRRPTPEQIARVLQDPEQVRKLRRRLSSLSWFMRLLCQPIAARANRESGVTGRFFAGRFKCKRIEDEAALLTCSIYINLNPIRAGLAATPETARHTSAFLRIQALLKRQGRGQDPTAELAPRPTDADSWLAPVFLDPRAAAFTSIQADRPAAPASPPDEGPACPSSPVTDKSSAEAASGPSEAQFPFPRRLTNKGFLPISLEEYLQLLDWTGRQPSVHQPAATIPADLQPILQRLGIRPAAWLEAVHTVDRYYPTAIGRRPAMEARAAKRGRRTLRGVRRSDYAFF